jgi:hypothetical protein
MTENTEKHLTNLCQTLTNQIEDLRLQLKIAEDKCKRYEYEQINRQDKIESLVYVFKIVYLCLNRIL